MAKKELFDKPLGRLFFKSLFVFPVNRGTPDIKSIKNSLALLEKGKAFGIFPEGTRSKDGSMLEFKAGSFKAATRTGCPIVPVAISGTENVFEKHMPAIRAADVKIRFGAPIRPSELAPEEKKHIAAYVQKRIEELLREEG